MGLKTAIAATLVFLASAGEASMNDQTLEGEALDSRIEKCGIRIAGDKFATLRPFIETSDVSLSGRYSIKITKISSSGRSVSSQANRFRDGRLGNNVIGVDRPSKVAIEMYVTSEAGDLLCRLVGEATLEEESIRL